MSVAWVSMLGTVMGSTSPNGPELSREGAWQEQGEAAF